MKITFIKSSKNHPCLFKRLFLCAVVLILCYQVTDGQCKLERLKDDYSASQTVYTKEVTLASVFPLIGTKKPWDLVMNFLLVDSTCTIIVTHKDQASSSNLEYIYFKFKDGSIIKKENPLNAGTYNTGLGYRFESTGFIITKDELKQFGSVDLLKFQASLKYNINYPLVDEEIKQKNIDKIRKDAACVLNEFNSVSNVKKEVKKEIKEVLTYNCGYEMDKIDAFTKKRNVLTKAAMFFYTKVETGQVYFSVCGNNTNGVNGLQFNYCFNVINVSKAYEDLKSLMLFDEVDILLENDEPISLKSDAISEFLLQDVNTAWSYKLFAIENDIIWQKLNTIPIKTLRLSKNGKELGTEEIDKNYSKSIVKVINCLDALNIPKQVTIIK